MKLYWVVTFEDLKPKGYAHGLESFERAQSWADGYTSCCAEQVSTGERAGKWLTSGAVAHGGPEWRDPDVDADWDAADAMVAKAQAQHAAMEAS